MSRPLPSRAGLVQLGFRDQSPLRFAQHEAAVSGATPSAIGASPLAKPPKSAVSAKGSA